MKKMVSRLMALMMVLTAFLIGGTEAVSAEDLTTNVMDWNGLCACFLDVSGQNANRIVLENDINAAEGSFERAILENDKSVILDLNGHSINGGAEPLKNLDIKGNLEIINSQATESTITNFANYAIWISGSGSVTINDGVKICGNSGAAAVYAEGDFVMNGGEISGNDVIDDDEHEVGAAVVLNEAGSLTLKGNAELSDNAVTHKSGGRYNCDVMLLNTASRIVLPEELKMDHPIGVASRSSMTITKGWSESNKDKDPAECFATAKMNSSIALDKTSGEIKYTIEKAANTLSVTAKSYTAKYSTLKKKSLTVARKKVLTVTKAKGTVTYSKVSGNKKITVSKKGTFTLKKGLKKGKYKVVVKVKAAGNSGYKSKTVKRTVVIKVK